MTQPVVIHQHMHAPRPVAVSTEEDAQRYLGIRHARHTYRHLGVRVTDLPGGRFAVLVEDVEKALRARGRDVIAGGAPSVSVDAASVLEQNGFRMVPR